jgi:hypothetical protein
LVNYGKGSNIREMITALVGKKPCHQYFELIPGDAQLLISSEEYGEEWWNKIENE